MLRGFASSRQKSSGMIVCSSDERKPWDATVEYDYD